MPEELNWWEQSKPTDWFPAEGEEDVVGRFEVRPYLHVAKSKIAGEHIYVPRIGIYMRAKNSADVSWQQLKPHNAKQLIRRFPKAWEVFDKARKKPEGRPLSDLGVDDETRFRMLGIMVETVEQLAETDDIRVDMVFGGKRLQQKAKSIVAENLTPPAPRRGRPPKVQPEAPSTA